MMSFSTAIKICFKKYLTISGRATRAEYWWFALFTTPLTILVVFLTATIAQSVGDEGALILWGIYIIVMLPPNFCVTVRRLHDVGLSGWWNLTLLLGGLGGIFLFIVSLEPSDDNNKYGPKPTDKPQKNQKEAEDVLSDENMNIETTDVEL